PPTLGVTETDHDAAVCAVLRWAKRTTGADVADAGHVCAVLGLDLSGAVARARDVGMSLTGGHDVGRQPT
ncbi:MAG: hypothetical protein ACRDS1_04200, partial [Pseudonocardiaceae bacterium]